MKHDFVSAHEAHRPSTTEHIVQAVAFRRRRDAALRMLVGCIVAFALSIGSAAHAEAAPAGAPMSDDSSFAFLLQASDYDFGSVSGSIALAKDLCKRMKAPSTLKGRKQAAKTIGRSLRIIGWPAGAIGYFLSITTSTYCPAQEPLTSYAF